MMKTARAELFSRYFDATDSDVIHFFVDGLVLVVDCDADRHLNLRTFVSKEYPQLEEARFEGQSVFVVPTRISQQWTPQDINQAHPIMTAPSSHFKDHRMLDIYELDGMAEFFQMGDDFKKPKTAQDGQHRHSGN